MFSYTRISSLILTFGDVSSQRVPGLGSLLANVTDKLGEDHVFGLSMPGHVYPADCGLATQAADLAVMSLIFVTVSRNEGIQLLM